MKRGDHLLLALLLLSLLTSGAYLRWFNTGRKGGLIATVVQDGKTIRQIDLSGVTAPYQFRIEDGSGGYNIIAVERGRIRVLEANCPEQVDVRQGWISEPHQSLICLPHRLTIQLITKGKSDVDIIVR